MKLSCFKSIVDISSKKLWMGIGVSLVLLASSCRDNPTDPCTDCPSDELISGDYNPTPYSLEIPEWMPRPELPADNPLTVEGIALGRHLFYEPMLSAEGSDFSCATCHLPEKAFTDGKPFSEGVIGDFGTRSSMSLANLVFNPRPLFWDGAAASLEKQALEPVENHLELNEQWPNVVEKLQNDDAYPAKFRAAFGIERTSEITKELAAKAIAQFERTLISANARFDQVIWLNDGWFTDEEERGRQLFFFELAQDVDHPGCSHCHFDPLFTNNEFMNNGLDNVENLEDFPDLGLGGVNGNQFDNGKFRVPTLRNIELTAPYMHDGRFQTLEEVLDHYKQGGHGVVNEDTNILSFTLSEQDKTDLIAFMKTLTDNSFIENENFQSPF